MLRVDILNPLKTFEQFPRDVVGGHLVAKQVSLSRILARVSMQVLHQSRLSLNALLSDQSGHGPES